MVPENELTTVLKCGYEGDRYPVTKVTWEKDGKPIQVRLMIRGVGDMVDWPLNFRSVLTDGPHTASDS